MIFYHGCPKKLAPAIRQRGLNAGSYVAGERFVAQGYASTMFDDEPTTVLTLKIPNNVVDMYLDTADDVASEVIRLIPPGFIE